MSIRERYRHLVENANDIIYQADARGAFTYVNPAAMRITGFDENELIGRHYLDLIDAEYRDAAEAFYRHQFEAREETTYFEFPMITKSGVRLWIGQNVMTISDGGRVTGYEAVARDITYRKGIEEELSRARDAAIESARSKSEFLANVSHEIRTPLNGVLGMTELLLHTPLAPEQREYAEAIRSSGETLLAIVNDVLDLARIEAGKLTVETIDFDVDDLVESVIESFFTRASAKRLKLRSFITPGVTRLLRGDAHRIRQVLLNLVGNAVKFTDRGEVVLTIMQPTQTEHGVTIRFLVTDTGIGIPAAVQRRLFTPFTQADGTTTRKYGGRGLGLAVSKQWTEAMGGEIGVMSVENEGSTFWFELPLGKQAESEGRPPRSWDLAKLRVLLVDANEVNRFMVARHLAATGIAIDEADSAANALAAMQQQKYDLIVFEMQLPDDDGLALARSIRAFDSNVRLVLLTTFGKRRSDVAAFHAAGVDAFLMKPIRRTPPCECARARRRRQRRQSARHARSTSPPRARMRRRRARRGGDSGAAGRQIRSRPDGLPDAGHGRLRSNAPRSPDARRRGVNARHRHHRARASRRAREMFDRRHERLPREAGLARAARRGHSFVGEQSIRADAERARRDGSGRAVRARSRARVVVPRHRPHAAGISRRTRENLSPGRTVAPRRIARRRIGRGRARARSRGTRAEKLQRQRRREADAVDLRHARRQRPHGPHRRRRSLG